MVLLEISSIVAPNLFEQWTLVLMDDSSIVTKQKTHSGYEIVVTTIGPIRTKPDEPENTLTHHEIEISVWFRGKELREVREVSPLRFASRDDADDFGFEIGRMIVRERRNSTAQKLIVRARNLFELPRWLFRNERIGSRLRRETGEI
ncbi:hypothetical protein ACYZT4_05225 [Pseudomonas sp. GB2N2]